MALKYKYTGKDQIPAEHATLYVEREGAFYLDAEGVTDKAKADEMRNHNIELRKQIEERDARFNGIDPDDLGAALLELFKIFRVIELECGITEDAYSYVPSRSRGFN